MAVDEKLFVARRLGFGLKAGEDLPGAPRDWALDQLRSVPPLDFFGADGATLHLPRDAQPIDNFADACSQWNDMRQKDDEQTKKFNDTIQMVMWMNYEALPRWRQTLALSLTAVNGQSPVFERFWHFWVNHFTVSTAENNGKVLQDAYMRLIRARMTGSFADLTFDVITSPAMLLYLDNAASVGPKSREGRNSGETLNENLGRELLELHTVSPAAGYTQDDVVQAALALTGWSFVPWYRDSKKFGTIFNTNRHEPGVRKIMGKDYKPKDGGANQLRDLVNDLAAHPSTIAHLSMKLAQAFISDTPPQDSVDRIAKVFADSNGDLVAIHTAVIEEVLTLGPSTRKLATPMTWLLQCYKVTGTPIDPAQPPGHSIDLIMKELGRPLDESPQPNGWSELAADWLSKALLDRRVRTAYLIGTATQDLLPDALGSYADRLMGVDSAAALSVKRAESMPLAIATLLTSPQFLWL
ncbi:MAG TPA: DUF1800 family protein [Bauldia sp.]|nr:DUF1800 family protein [Bauldia sp.]